MSRARALTIAAGVGLLSALAVVGFSAVHMATEDDGLARTGIRIASPAVTSGGSDSADGDIDDDGDAEGTMRDLDVDDPATVAVAHPTPSQTPSASRPGHAPSASADD